MKPNDYWKRRRNGILLSSMQFAVLKDLYNAKQAGYDFVFLPNTHARTLNPMFELDWIFKSPGIDGVRYKITKRGEEVFHIFDRQPYRNDGLCPQCGQRPRETRKKGHKKGRLAPYCSVCKKEVENRRYHKNGRRLNPETLCSRCKQRPRHVYPSGNMITYCYECRADIRKEEKQRQAIRLLEQLQTDSPPLCIRCKSAPRYSTGKTVYDYCYTCYRETQNEWMRRHKLRAAKAFMKIT